jgi:hypothetical protein
MWNEVLGCVPKLPVDFAQTLVNRAWADIRRKHLWSFLLFDANWTSPAIINAGSAAVTQGSPSVTFNTAAQAAITASGSVPSAITARQFRVGAGTIYNIWAYNSGTGVATIDRAYQEPSAAAATYSIYQVYYPAPMQDFLTFMTVRDMTNWNDLVLTRSRAWADERDPQRTIYYIPTHTWFYTADQNPASSTYTWPLFELWGSPQQVLTWQLYGLRKGTALVNPADTLPPAVGEDCVIELSKSKAYEWAEANKGQYPEMQGPDYRFLMGRSAKEYDRLFREYRKQDRETVDNWRVTRRLSYSTLSMTYGTYNSIAGVASPGAAW